MLNLQALGHALAQTPPSITAITKVLAKDRALREFIQITSNYLPAHSTRIISAPSSALSIELFTEAWEQDYFPLHPIICDQAYQFQGDDDFSPYHALTNGIAIDLCGYDYSAAENLWDGPEPYSLLSLLTPHTGHYYTDDQEHAALLKLALVLVDQDTLDRIPRDRFSSAHLQLAAQATNDPRIAHLLRWLDQSTGNIFADDYHDQDDVDIYQGSWTPETINRLTQAWQEYLPIGAAINSVISQLGLDPDQTLNLILDEIQRVPGDLE